VAGGNFPKPRLGPVLIEPDETTPKSHLGGFRCFLTERVIVLLESQRIVTFD
jgi:hypothetical protein